MTAGESAKSAPVCKLGDFGETRVKKESSMSLVGSLAFMAVR